MSLEDCLSRADSELTCPGRYCARVILNESICLFSECQRCPRGFRPFIENTYANICKPCLSQATFYDYLYLIFMLNIAILMHLVSIDKLFDETKNRKWPKFNAIKITTVYVLPVVENIIALLASILAFPPNASLKLHSCLVHSFYDWYSIFFDPYVDFFKKLNCSQEIVYPLYSLVVVYFLFSALIMITVRPIVSKCFLKEDLYTKLQSKSIFAALHYLPILIIIHLIAGGLLYYSFPVITIICVVLSNNFYLSKVYDFRISQKNYLMETINNTYKLLKVPRNLATILINWYLFTFGIVSLTRFENGLLDLLYIFLIPGPLIFYVISFKYTNPKNT